jgi:hypothetical protein
MSDATERNESVSISIIKFVSDQVENERALTDKEFSFLKELIFARFNSEKEAANLAYVELQRRLDMLNHAHEEAKQKEGHFLPRENFEQFFKDFGTWRDQVNDFQSNLIGKISLGVGAMGIILFLLAHYWR